MTRYTKDTFFKISLLSLLTFLVGLSSAYAQDNYVELGDQSNASSFYEKESSGITEDFRIPVFNKKRYESRAVTWPTPIGSPLTANEKKIAKGKSKNRLMLEEKLKRLRIIPIPKYKFGKEKVLGANKMVLKSKNFKIISKVNLKVKKMPNLISRVVQAAKIDVKSATKRTLSLKNPNPNVIQTESVQSVNFTAEGDEEFKPLGLFFKDPKNPKQLEVLTADILFQEKKSCEEVTPLTEYLKDVKTKDFRLKYYRGMCLHKNKMYTESIPLLAKVIGKSTDYYAMNAVSEVIKDLPKGYEPLIAEGLAPKNVYNKLEQAQKDKYNYILGKGYFIKENYKRAEVHSKIVSKASPDHNHAQFLLSTSQYMSGKLQNGIRTISSLKESYFKKKTADEDFKSLIHITLARFLFERGIYDQSIKEYSKVGRSHSLWVDSLIEKGWAQLQIGDFKGAIGNMFTLMSPFFKDAFIPEAQVIQTIGYLNICQFADADKTLSYLEATYPQQKTDILNYVKADNSHYKTLTSYITDENTDKIFKYQGLPTSVVREMGRDREYLDAQQKLNNVVDEIPRFNQFVRQLAVKTNELATKLGELTASSKDLKAQESEAVRNKNTELAKRLKSQRKKIYEKGLSFTYRIATFNKGIKAFKIENRNAVARATKLRDGYLTVAENKLRTSMSDIDARLNVVLRNNDLLRYEVFANSGQNIRYRTSGGKVQDQTKEDLNRIPTTVEKDKDYGWNFKGEFWEDEIGNFRSQLQNLCPKGK